jgi:hypothetical protein
MGKLINHSGRDHLYDATIFWWQKYPIPTLRSPPCAGD